MHSLFKNTIKWFQYLGKPINKRVLNCEHTFEKDIEIKDNLELNS